MSLLSLLWDRPETWDKISWIRRKIFPETGARAASLEKKEPGRKNLRSLETGYLCLGSRVRPNSVPKLLPCTIERGVYMLIISPHTDWGAG